MAQGIQFDDEFAARLAAAAARTTDRTYPPSDHVELQIYGNGWPSDEDVAACKRFHESPSEMRLDIALALADLRFRSADASSISNGPISCGRPTALHFDAEVARRVRGGNGDFRWMTLPQALAEIEEHRR